jgi:hypothetical protein
MEISFKVQIGPTLLRGDWGRTSSIDRFSLKVANLRDRFAFDCDHRHSFSTCATVRSGKENRDEFPMDREAAACGSASAVSLSCSRTTMTPALGIPSLDRDGIAGQ